MKKVLILFSIILLAVGCGTETNDWQKLGEDIVISCDNGFSMTIEEFEKNVNNVDSNGDGFLFENKDNTTIIISGTSCITNSDFISV